MEVAAKAAAVSPAKSDPGFSASILAEGRAIVMSSGRPTQEWSILPSPTWGTPPSILVKNRLIVERNICYQTFLHVVLTKYTDLSVESIRVWVSFDEIICSPLQCFFQVVQLTGIFIGLFVGYSSPGKDCHGISHGESKFHVIPSWKTGGIIAIKFMWEASLEMYNAIKWRVWLSVGRKPCLTIVVASGKVKTDVWPIPQGRVLSPSHPLVWGKFSRSLRLVKQ